MRDRTGKILTKICVPTCRHYSVENDGIIGKRGTYFQKAVAGVAIRTTLKLVVVV